MDKELEDMEQKIIQISEDQATKLDPKKIAFFTMNDGTIMVVNKKEDIKQEPIKEEINTNIPQKFIQKPLEYIPPQTQNQPPRQVDQSIKFPMRPIYYDERQQRRHLDFNSNTFPRTLNHCQSEVCHCEQPVSIVRNTYTIQRPRRVVRRITPSEYFYGPEAVYVEEVPLYTAQVRNTTPYERPNFVLPNEPQTLPENISPKKVVNRVRKLPKLEENPIRGSYYSTQNIYSGLDMGEPTSEINYAHKMRPTYEMEEEPLPYCYRPITPAYHRRPIFVMDNPEEELYTEYYRPRNRLTYVGY